ncbi:hypothetical protein yruck0001_8690 [Yersinia ruckeri ATCC 29473]|nr:hypothetical protein yruck0001_8690 [Yersinia ruckeri ATCC 29473]
MVNNPIAIKSNVNTHNSSLFKVASLAMSGIKYQALSVKH